MMKSSTDIHWNERAKSVANDIEVNIMDIFQRELEYDYICRYLTSDMRVVEAGCGNGFSTERFRPLVKHVDAFDYAENMIERAKERIGETNNSFFCDNLLDLKQVKGPYDTAICVRVLINLQNLEQQRLALRNLSGLVRPGGLLILAEGYVDGFEALNELRSKVELPAIEPAKINFYSFMRDLLPEIEKDFEMEDRFHLGAYDYLTRVFYPLLVGAENAKHNTVFSEKCRQIASAFNPDCFKDLSRMQGFVLRKRA